MHPPSEQRVSWLTAMINDNFVIGAVLTGYVIQKLSCHQHMIALVSDTVTPKSREALRKAGYEVRVVEPLDCNWMERQMGRTPTSSGIPGNSMLLIVAEEYTIMVVQRVKNLEKLGNNIYIRDKLKKSGNFTERA